MWHARMGISFHMTNEQRGVGHDGCMAIGELKVHEGGLENLFTGVCMRLWHCIEWNG